MGAPFTNEALPSFIFSFINPLINALHQFTNTALVQTVHYNYKIDHVIKSVIHTNIHLVRYYQSRDNKIDHVVKSIIHKHTHPNH